MPNSPEPDGKKPLPIWPIEVGAFLTCIGSFGYGLYKLALCEAALSETSLEFIGFVVFGGIYLYIEFYTQ